MKIKIAYLLVVSTVFILAACATQNGERKSIEPRNNVEQMFLYQKPEKTKASIVVLPGGKGKLNLQGKMNRWPSKDFPVRTRDRFVDHNIAVAILDAPSDRQNRLGLQEYVEDSDEMYRMTETHSNEIKKIVKYIKQDTDAPVWILGMSMGSISATNAAISLDKELDGLVLISSATRTKENWPIHEHYPRLVVDMKLDKIHLPTLVLYHKDDECWCTPPEGANEIASRLTNSKKLKVKGFEGGDAPQSDPCLPMSEHGFLGIEEEVVDEIIKFIQSNSL